MDVLHKFLYAHIIDFQGPGRADQSLPVIQSTSATVTVDPLASWMEGVERICRRLNRTTEGAPRDYVERICSSFLDNLDKDLIYEKVVRLGRLQKSAYRHENEVYTLVGVEKEYQTAREVAKKVNVVLSWVEEILCYAMVDAEEVREHYVAKMFMYQAK